MNTILAWRNWCWEAGTIDTTVSPIPFEPEAPLTNLLTPQTSMLAIKSTSASVTITMNFDGWDDPQPVGRPVHIVGLMNHNIVRLANLGYLTLELFDENDIAYTPAQAADPGIFAANSLGFQSHMYWLIPDNPGGGFDREKVVRFNLTLAAAAFLETGTIDPVTGIITPGPFQAGGLWAGPLWRPKHGLRFATPQYGVIETQRGAVSIGGQYYAQPQPRRRTLAANLTLVDEVEATSTTDPGLQQMAAWCGTSRPVICLPDVTDPHIVYTLGIYGYFDSPVMWGQAEAIQSRADVGKPRVRTYTSSVAITEAL